MAVSANTHVTIPLGQVLAKSDDWIELDPLETYTEVSVRLWGKGVVPRGQRTGSEIGGSRRLRVRPRQFILSRIDARNGALGLVPPELGGAVVSNDFPTFNVDEDRLLPEYLGWMSRTRPFVDECQAVSEGTTNRVRLREDKFYQMRIPLPPLAGQRRIVARIEYFASRIEEARILYEGIQATAVAMLRATFSRLVDDVQWLPMSEIAPLVRRPVNVQIEEAYPELGVRSFGKGTFHKPSLNGFEVGSKKLYCIQPGDLVFNNVFAWEGAVAVAQERDGGRVGSHRFITCVPDANVVTADFLCFYFLTNEGLRKLGEASPGGAGRNRTLGLKKLEAIEVPVPSLDRQRWFDSLQERVGQQNALQAKTAAELDALLPSILDEVFKGDL